MFAYFLGAMLSYITLVQVPEWRKLYLGGSTQKGGPDGPLHSLIIPIKSLLGMKRGKSKMLSCHQKRNRKEIFQREHLFRRKLSKRGLSSHWEDILSLPVESTGQDEEEILLSETGGKRKN